MAGKVNNLDGNQIEFEQPLEPRYICSRCKSVLLSTFQTQTCGHRFCKECIYNLITLGSKKCPVDNTTLVMKDIFPDKFCDRQIMALKCFCSRKYRGCNWTGNVYEFLKEHQFQCPKQMLSCLKGCQLALARSEMQDHIASCPMPR